MIGHRNRRDIDWAAIIQELNKQQVSMSWQNTEPPGGDWEVVVKATRVARDWAKEVHWSLSQFQLHPVMSSKSWPSLTGTTLRIYLSLLKSILHQILKGLLEFRVYAQIAGSSAEIMSSQGMGVSPPSRYS